MKRFWMIVNLNQAYDDFVLGRGAMRFYEDCEPHVIWLERGRAERELLKLKRERHDGKFVLLESVAECKVVIADDSGGGVLLRIEEMEGEETC